MKNFFKSLKKNNKGMSLVEAIIAVAILSVAVIPVLACFSSTVRYSAIAKVKQRGTNTAMSVMESFKAYGLEESNKKFKNGNFLTSAPSDVSYGAPATGLFGTYTINNLSFSDDEAATSKKYRVEVEIGEYQKIDPASGIQGTPFYNPNNGVQFIEDPKEDYSPSYYIKQYIDGRPDIDKEKVSDINFTREIHFDVKDTGEVVITYKFNGKYKYNGVSTSMKDSIGNPIPDKTVTLSCTNPLDLQTIFFYYYPAYNDRASNGITVKDEFYFSNNFKDDIKLYISKQRDSSRSKYDLKNLEPFYTIYFGNGQPSSLYTLDVYDVVNQNIGLLDGSALNIYDGFTQSYLSSKVHLYNGLGSVTSNQPVSATITIKVIDDHPIFNSNPEIVTLQGTIML